MPIENDPWHSPDDDQTPGQPDEQEPHGSEHGKRGKKRKRKMSLSQYYARNPEEDPYYRSKPPPKVPYSHASPKPLTPNSGYVPPPPPTPEQRQRDTVSLLYMFIIGVSVVLSSCGLFASVGGAFDRPNYSIENIELRVNRLYMTGYDPLMNARARSQWIGGHKEPERFEIERVGYGSIGITATVIVERNGEIELDVVEFNTHGEIYSYRPDAGSYYDEYTFTDAVQEVDPSVYPTSVGEIPEAYTK